MSVNSMNIEQAANVLGEVVALMDGQPIENALPAADFVSVAREALQQGYDKLSTAISQVLSRRLYSIRPYKSKMEGLMWDTNKWGGVVQKINYIDGELENDQQLYKTGTTPYVNGDVPTPDQYAYRKPLVFQSNYYGAEQFQRVTTRYRSQLDTAMSGPAELVRFISGQYQNVADQLEQVREAKKRLALINFIGGKIALDAYNTHVSGNQTHVLHLFTMYNDKVNPDVDIDIDNWLQPEYFDPFVKWLYATIKTYVGYMEERNTLYHFAPSKDVTTTSSGTTIELWPLKRHTPRNQLHAYFVSEPFNLMQTSVLAEIFHKDELKMVDYEAINYIQAIDTPFSINAEVTVNNPLHEYAPGTNVTDGSDLVKVTVGEDQTTNLTTGKVKSAPVLGVLFDDEAVGTSIAEHWQHDTPMNAATGHINTFWHETDKLMNDFTENGVVLMLD